MVGDRLADEAQALRDVTDWLDKFVRTGMPQLIELQPVKGASSGSCV
jgi:hypothetical protein